jgi:ankyrin repeat protein
MGEYSSPLDAALLGAARTGDHRWVERLFELGADTSWVNKFGQTALIRCLEFFPEKMEWIERLISDATLTPKAAKMAQLPIRIALRHDACDAFFLLMERGAVLDTPLFEAAEAGSHKIATRLLKTGHNPDERTEDGCTALMMAKTVEVASALLRAGADIDAQDKSGYSALYNSCSKSNVELAGFLLESGASTEIRHLWNRTVAFSLATPPSTEIGKLLLKHGVDLSVRDDNGDNVADACREMAGVVKGSNPDRLGPIDETEKWVQRQLRGGSSDLRAMLEWLADHGVT